MSIDLLSLPLVVLDIMFDYLPLWKIRQLACMCHDMNNLKKSAFSRRRHLRLFGGTVYKNYLFMTYGHFYNINHDFDLNIRFEGEIKQNSLVTLSPDLYVRNAHQINQLVRWFPNIRNLILVVANQWPQDCQARLLGLWPQIESLKIINISQLQLDWPQVGPQLNALTKLKHLVFCPFVREAENAKNHLEPLLLTGRLKTFISIFNFKYVWRNSDNILISSRDVWNGPGLESAVEQLDTFGITHYTLSSGIKFANSRVLQKIKHLHIIICDSIRNLDLTNLMGLCYLNICCDGDLRTVFEYLGALPNLNHLYLQFVANKLKIPSEQACKRWPKLPSVRRFELNALVDPCRISSIAHSFPNAEEISCNLYVNIIDYNGSGRNFIKLQQDSLCTQCLESIERSIDKLNTIEAFIWYYNRNHHGRHELVPKVKFFTVEIEGKTRISSDYHLID